MRSFLFFTALLIPQFLTAAGSCTWDDVMPLVAGSPAILAHVNSTMDVEQTGSAIRLGKHYTNLSGRRVAPYVFRARSKGATGPFQFELVVETEARFFDQNNQLIADEATDDILTATALKETLAAVSIRPLVKAEEIPALTSEEAENIAARIRTQFNEINLREHRVSAVEFEAEDEPLSGKVVLNRHPASGAMELITVDGATGDHSGFSEAFYFWDGELIFVFRQETHWSFHPQNPNQTIDSVKEERFYFYEGQIFRALKKSYEGGGPERLQKAQKAAENQAIALNGSEAPEFYSRASRLLIARKSADALTIYQKVFSQ